jgi:FtsP/CotA-like multicopper oxidase with cupredoxin domain
MLLPAPMISRRCILAGAGAAVVSCSAPFGLDAQEAPDLTPDGFQILRALGGSIRLAPPEAAAIPIWGYQGAVPGPLLRVRRGEELRVRLSNELSDPTAIHWHGVRVPNLMDGVPGITQAAVAPGARFAYRFRPPDAGTFWYHAPWYPAPALAAATATVDDQAARRRLYGLLIVEEAEPVAVDREHALVLDEWPTSPEDQGNKAKPVQIMANAMPVPDLAVRANERLRLRLVNAARTRVVALRLERHAAQVMAIDGQPVEPFRARDDRVTLGPGNTADLFIDATLEPGAVAPILLADASGETPLAHLVYDRGAPRRPDPLAPPPPLPANPLPARIDLAHAVKLDWPIDAPARGSMVPSLPRFRVKRGRSVLLGLVNRTEFACAVHLHGHAFRLLDRLDDGWKPFWLSTVLVDARQTTRIAFLADNPGKWLIEWVGIDHPEWIAGGCFEVT